MAAAAWVRDVFPGVLVQGRGGCGSGRKGRGAPWETGEEWSERKEGTSGGWCMEAKEERVSRKKGWPVTVQPIQKVDQSVDQQNGQVQQSGRDWQASSL